MRVNKIECDICHSLIYDYTHKKGNGWKFKFKDKLRRYKLDICEECLNKLYLLSTTIPQDKEIADIILNSKTYQQYLHEENEYIASVYLHGANDVMDLLIPSRIIQRGD